MRQAVFSVVASLVCGLPSTRSSIASESIAATRILVMPDTSGSLDGREYEMALASVSSLIERLCESNSIRELDLLPWASASDCWRTPVARIGLPIRKELPKAPPLELDEVSRLFRLTRNQKIEQADHLRAEGQERLDREYRKGLAKALSLFRGELERCHQGRSACTALTEMVRRCSLEPRSTCVILITDGKPECAQAGRGTLEAGARTLIVLVPSQDDDRSGNDGCEARLSNLMRLAPWAKVIPSFRLADEGLDWLSLLENQGPGFSLTESRSAPSGGGR